MQMSLVQMRSYYDRVAAVSSQEETGETHREAGPGAMGPRPKDGHTGPDQSLLRESRPRHTGGRASCLQNSEGAKLGCFSHLIGARWPQQTQDHMSCPTTAGSPGRGSAKGPTERAPSSGVWDKPVLKQAGKALKETKSC